MSDRICVESIDKGHDFTKEHKCVEPLVEGPWRFPRAVRRRIGNQLHIPFFFFAKRAHPEDRFGLVGKFELNGMDSLDACNGRIYEIVFLLCLALFFRIAEFLPDTVKTALQDF